MKPERVCTIIVACVVLQNIAALRNEPGPDSDDENEEEGYEIIGHQFEDGHTTRQYLCQTFFFKYLYMLKLYICITDI